MRQTEAQGLWQLQLRHLHRHEHTRVVSMPFVLSVQAVVLVVGRETGGACAYRVHMCICGHDLDVHVRTCACVCVVRREGGQAQQSPAQQRAGAEAARLHLEADLVRRKSAAAKVKAETEAAEAKSLAELAQQRAEAEATFLMAKATTLEAGLLAGRTAEH